MRIQVKNICKVSETLFLPLYFRAVESKRSDAILKDELSEDLISKIDYDFSKLEGKILTQTATMLRIREFDRLIRSFLEEHPNSTVVNIGCGLDTRFYRVDNGLVKWYELDLPEVIALRRKFFIETERYHFIGSSVFDFSWMDVILLRPEQAILFLSEGVLMYLPEAEVKNLLKMLKERFRGATLIFDAVSPLQVWMSTFHPVISTTNNYFQWGLLFGKVIETWDTGICLQDECFYLDQELPRFGWFNLLRLFPHIQRGFSILKCKLGEA